MALSDIFISTGDIEFPVSSTRLSGNVLSIYAIIQIRGKNNGNLNPKYRPSCKNVIGIVFEASAPYAAIGSIWFYSTGEIYIYGVESGKGYIISMSWVID